MKVNKETRLYLKQGETGKYYAHKAIKNGCVGVCYVQKDKVVGFTPYDDLIKDLKSGPYVELD